MLYYVTATVTSKKEKVLLKKVERNAVPSPGGVVVGGGARWMRIRDAYHSAMPRVRLTVLHCRLKLFDVIRYAAYVITVIIRPSNF